MLGAERANTKALIFNVKGEDLLFLDRPNTQLADEHREIYAALGLPAAPFASVGFYAPPRPADPAAGPNVATRKDGAVRAFFWSASASGLTNCGANRAWSVPSWSASFLRSATTSPV